MAALAGRSVNRLPVGARVSGVPMAMRSGEPPAALTTRGPVAVAALPMLPTLLLALPLSACATVVVMRPTPWLATLIGPRTLALAPVGPACAPRTLRLAIAAPSRTLGASRP
ncbi:hypothetical protein IXO222_21160 [Xanthomonas oryzae pv. oryzae]|nr:hypothetical protein IXO222_21160 [Xanthomonas oryzae pv. oryzae]